MELEAAASAHGHAPAYPFSIEPTREQAPFVVDLRPVVRAVAADVRRRRPAPEIAARYHATLARAILEGCRTVRASRPHLRTVALSGGCFQSRILTEGAARLLAADGFEVMLHRRVPPNDGGLALGQAAVAAYRLRVPGSAGSERSPKES